jgi:hypothetical protein
MAMEIPLRTAKIASDGDLKIDSGFGGVAKSWDLQFTVTRLYSATTLVSAPGERFSEPAVT